MKIKLHLKKAIFYSLIYLILLVIVPCAIFSYLQSTDSSIPITFDVIGMIMTLGIVSSISGFLKALFEPGTRLHGFMNVIFAAWFTYNVYYLLGGGLGGIGAFGTYMATFSNYNLSINLSIIAYIVIAMGVFSVILYLYEILGSPGKAKTEPVSRIKKKAKIVKKTTVAITLINIMIIAYGASIVYSIARTNVLVVDPQELPAYNVNNPIDLNDDTIDYYVNLTIENRGIYPINYLHVDIEVYVENSTNELLLPPDTLFASTETEFGIIDPNTARTNRINLKIELEVSSTLLADCWLRNEFKITTSVSMFNIHVNGHFISEYDHPF